MSQSGDNVNNRVSVSDSTSSNLLDQARDADSMAWNRIQELYGPLIRGWCQQAQIQEATIDDLVQEVLISVYGALDRFQRIARRGSFRNWLKRITQNKINDHYRRLRKVTRAIGGSDAVKLQQQVPERKNTSNATVNQADALVLLDTLQEQFSPQTWKAFFLVTFRDYTSVEAAKELEMTPNAVRLANGRVRRRLREELKFMVE